MIRCVLLVNMEKKHRQGHPIIIDSKSIEPLELLHIDLCGLSTVESLNKKKYILVIFDDFQGLLGFSFFDRSLKVLK